MMKEDFLILVDVITTAWKNLYGTNVDVNNQSHNHKKNLLFADWLFTTTT